MAVYLDYYRQWVDKGLEIGIQCRPPELFTERCICLVNTGMAGGRKLNLKIG